jgi:hypothetical protein
VTKTAIQRRCSMTMAATAVTFTLFIGGRTAQSANQDLVAGLTLRPVPTTTRMPYGHLFVADPYAKTVYRFPLMPDGLPSKSPDGMLQSPEFVVPLGLAVAENGNLFVSDELGKAVYEFAPGASGSAHPIRRLLLSGQAGYMAVDHQGYIFVANLGVNAIQIYRPGAHGSDPLLHSIPFAATIAPSILVDRRGRLYVSQPGKVVTVYDTPVTQWRHPDHVLRVQGGYEYDFAGSIGIDETRHALYINFYPSQIQPWDADDFAIRDLRGNEKDQWILTRDCTGPPPGPTPGGATGIVISGAYLLFTCPATAIFAYPNEPGKRRLVDQVGNGLFISTGDVKLGR